jgi:hypothetical protein
LRFAVECADLSLGARIAAVLEGLADCDDGIGPDVRYRIDGAGGAHVLSLDDDVVAGGLSRAEVVDWLVWDLSRASAAASREHLLLHAGAASRGGAGVVVPGNSGMGKSTLIGALVLAGFDYLSDEMAALSVDGRIDAFARPLGLDDDARGVLTAAFPGALDQVDEAPVAPDELRPGAVAAASASLRLVVLPRRGRGGPFEPELLPPADALLELIAHTVNLDVHGGLGMAALAALSERCPCVRVATDDIGAACAAVTTLLEMSMLPDTTVLQTTVPPDTQ